MVQPAKKNATYQDVLDSPEGLVAELIAGELYVQPRPTIIHCAASSVLGMLLGPPYRLGRGGPGGWIILDEPELHLGGDVLVPDLAGWRLSAHPDLELQGAFAQVAPDWVCEVLSPSTQGRDRVKKLPLYGRQGVGHAWIIDPAARTLEVFRWREAGWFLLSTHEGEDQVAAEPFELVTVPLSELWGG